MEPRIVTGAGGRTWKSVKSLVGRSDPPPLAVVSRSFSTLTPQDGQPTPGGFVDLFGTSRNFQQLCFLSGHDDCLIAFDFGDAGGLRKLLPFRGHATGLEGFADAFDSYRFRSLMLLVASAHLARPAELPFSNREWTKGSV
jgi:hypothetical protein